MPSERRQASRPDCGQRAPAGQGSLPEFKSCWERDGNDPSVDIAVLPSHHEAGRAWD